MEDTQNQTPGADAHDWEILAKADQKGNFIMMLGATMCDHQKAAFERGVDKNWWQMVDIRFVPSDIGPTLARIFKLTNYGEARRATLQKKYGNIATH